MRLMQLKITFDLTDDAAGQAASGPRSPTDRHPANRTKYPLFENGRTFPFSQSVVGDPVGGGFVDSLARPGGNVTGFMNFEYSISGKWLELLKEVAPGVTRVAVL